MQYVKLLIFYISAFFLVYLYKIFVMSWLERINNTELLIITGDGKESRPLWIESKRIIHNENNDLKQAIEIAFEIFFKGIQK